MSKQEDSTVLNELTSHIKPRATWKDLDSVPDAELERLRDIAGHARRTARKGQREPDGRRKRGNITLFSGPSRTGKTMAAEVLARELGTSLYRVDLSLVISKYIGETEKNLNRLFSAAEKVNATLFFDEADALLGKRSEVKDSHDRYANMNVEGLLQRMEDYAGLVILATNLKENISQAFIRRFQSRVHFSPPNKEA